MKFSKKELKWLEDHIDLATGEDGELLIDEADCNVGIVTGSVGYVHGDVLNEVWGDVHGDIGGHIKGGIGGNVGEDITGKVKGKIKGEELPEHWER